jgi:hypothetical protein
MKKMAYIMVVIMVLLIGLTACSSNTARELPKSEAVLTAKVIKLYESSMLIVGENAYDLFMVPMDAKIFDENDAETDRAALLEGQKIELGYSGAIMESYPAQLAGLEYIKIVEEGDDLVGLYATVIDDLWKTDEGLNSGVEIMAFDLSLTTNLSESEKQALAYVVGNAYELQGMVATYDALVEQGYVDPDSLNFEKGLFFKLEVKDTSADKFTFDASKWRGGDGAYFFIDCIAKKSGDGWTYKVGSEAIS